MIMVYSQDGTKEHNVETSRRKQREDHPYIKHLMCIEENAEICQYTLQINRNFSTGQFLQEYKKLLYQQCS